MSWTTNKYITSRFESYTFAISELDKTSTLKTFITDKAKHKMQLFTSITNVDFARLVLKMFSIFYAAVQKCQADTTYH